MDAVNERQRVLDTAAQIVAVDRNVDYGSPKQNFEAIASLWSTYICTEFAPHDVAAMMILMKVARLQTSPHKDDNWIDIAGYAACGSEVRPDSL